MEFRRTAILLVTVPIACLLYHAAAAAANFTSLTYDEKADKLIIAIAYRGTHENHAFSIQWGECRQLDDGRQETYGLLVDSDPMDLARQDFFKVLKIDMMSFPCRPARITLRTAEGFRRSIDLPAPKEKY